MQSVTPTMPVAPYLGGKKNLAKVLIPLIDAQHCTTYAEPFVGMGGIFLRRTSRPKSEVINDLVPGRQQPLPDPAAALSAVS